MISVSVIIPVYNKEDYLNKCIQSVLDQSLSNMEIICIDDGSVDNSYKIIRKYATNDNRIKIIRQSNKGVSNARNIGIRSALGKYIAFMDADDFYVDNTALKVMFELCESKNIPVCGSNRMILNGNKLNKQNVFESDMFQVNENIIYDYYQIQCDYNFQSYIFRKNFLLNNNLLFPELIYYEDPPFLVKTLYCARNFLMTSKNLYGYRLSLKPRYFSYEQVRDLLKGLYYNLEFSYENGLDRLFETTLSRIEYEYGNGIRRFLNDSIVFQKMKIINDKLKSIYDNENYLIRPLREFMTNNYNSIDSYKVWLIDNVENCKTFYVYGAGRIAKQFVEWLGNNFVKKKLDFVIVSSKSGDSRFFGGVPVIDIDEYSYRTGDYIIVATGEYYHYEIMKELERRFIKNYSLLDTMLLQDT